ncbi:MAG TPA: hypothetical protein PL182_07765, partial [Pseudobdellovibrionaceae bacterium]|nr:hypothetical protein [Pseudobdellovibrionaceae bacterium]
AVLKGDHEKEFAWFTVANSLPGLSMSAEKAAQKIIQAIREGRTDLRLSVPTRLALWFQQLFPETFHALMGFTDGLLPRQTSRIRKTGAESQAWLNRQAWSGPIQKLQKLTQRNYNEAEKSDADYNLNLKSP